MLFFFIDTNQTDKQKRVIFSYYPITPIANTEISLYPVGEAKIEKQIGILVMSILEMFGTMTVTIL